MTDVANQDKTLDELEQDRDYLKKNILCVRERIKTLKKSLKIDKRDYDRLCVSIALRKIDGQDAHDALRILEEEKLKGEII